VVREWDDRGTNTQDHRRMDLAMSVGIHSSLVLQIRDVHSDHAGLFFFDIDELTEALFQCVIKIDVVMEATL